MLFTDYDVPFSDKNEKHVFTDIQKGFRSWIDHRVLGLDDNTRQSNDGVPVVEKGNGKEQS